MKAQFPASARFAPTALFLFFIGLLLLPACRKSWQFREIKGEYVGTYREVNGGMRPRLYVDSSGNQYIRNEFVVDTLEIPDVRVFVSRQDRDSVAFTMDVPGRYSRVLYFEWMPDSDDQHVFSRSYSSPFGYSSSSSTVEVDADTGLLSWRDGSETNGSFGRSFTWHYFDGRRD